LFAIHMAFLTANRALQHNCAMEPLMRI
jgi:hypothetical protein